MSDSTARFTSRVADYVRSRPTYPAGVIDTLLREGAITVGGLTADVGSGTGIFSKLLLQRGIRVNAVEPNDAMRSAAEAELGAMPGYRSIHARAEATTLERESVDLVTAAQAFHWFDRDSTRREFQRILRPPRWVALIWNERLTDTPFLKDYDWLLINLSTEYQRVDHRRIDTGIVNAFFAPLSPRRFDFPNLQIFDWEGLVGRALSSSYVPSPGHSHYEPFMAALRQAFDKHSVNGHVEFRYQTHLHLGALAE